MLSVLLVSACTARFERVEWASGYSSAPLGLMYLASVLRMHGHEAHCLDQLVETMSIRSFRELLTELRPDVVGISAYTESVAEALSVARMAREHGAIVVMGGAHASFVPDHLLESGVCDYVARFESEATIVELMTWIEYGAPQPDRIRGLSFRDAHGEIRHNERRPHIDNLDGLPLPAIDLMPAEKYACPLVCLSSRGCPGRCLFCLSPPLHGGRWRGYSTDRLVSEVHTLARKNPGLPVVIIDDTFTVKPRRLAEFCRELRHLCPSLVWSCYSRIDALDTATVRMMADAGCIGIQLGIETGDQRVADAINKRISLERAEEVVGIVANHGIMPLCSLMVGHHADTTESIAKTMDCGRRLKDRYRALVTYAICTPFPGSPIYEHCERLGVRLHAGDWSDFVMTQPFISTRNLSIEDLRGLYFDASQENVTDRELMRYWRKVLEERLGYRGGVVIP